MQWHNLNPADLAADLRHRLWETGCERRDLQAHYERTRSPITRAELLVTLAHEARLRRALDTAEADAVRGWSSSQTGDSIALTSATLLRLHAER